MKKVLIVALSLISLSAIAQQRTFPGKMVASQHPTFIPDGSIDKEVSDIHRIIDARNYNQDIQNKRIGEAISAIQLLLSAVYEENITVKDSLYRAANNHCDKFNKLATKFKQF